MKTPMICRRIALVAVTAVLGCATKAPVPTERQYKIVGVPIAPDDTTKSLATKLEALHLEKDTACGWGSGKKSELAAEILSVGVEYFPTVGARAPYPRAKSAGDTTYTIAATAHYHVTVRDSVEYERNPGAYKGDIIVEALSEGETVMERSRLTAPEAGSSIVPGDGSVSAKWEGLPASEMERIRFIRARWKFGR